MYRNQLPPLLKAKVEKCKLCNKKPNSLFYCHIHNEQVNILEKFTPIVANKLNEHYKPKVDLSQQEKRDLLTVIAETKEFLSNQRWKKLDNGERLYHHRGVLLEFIAILTGIEKATHQDVNGYRLEEGYLSEKLESLSRDVLAIAKGEY